MNRRQPRPWNGEYETVQQFLEKHPLPPDDRGVHVCGAPERTWVDFEDYKPEVGEEDILFWFGWFKEARVCTYLGWDEKNQCPLYETDNPEFMGWHPHYWMWYNQPPRKIVRMSFHLGEEPTASSEASPGSGS